VKSSVVIRSFNEERHIGRLLVGIMEQTLKNVEIILVDSGSTDATIAIASQFPVQVVHIKPEDFSFGRALNTGCAQSKGEFIVIASAHVFPVYHNWLEQLLKPFTDPAVGLVYGKQRGGETTKYSERQVFAQWFPDESVANQDPPFCNNANTAVRRTLWEKFPYDEELTGLEDLDWAKRIGQEGYGISYNPQAEIIHLHDETLKNIYNRYRREAIALKRIFPEQHFSLWEFIQLSTANIFSDYYHALQDGCLLMNLGDIPMFRIMQFWGAYRGFHRRGPITSSLKRSFYYPRGFERAKPQDTNETDLRIEYDRKITEYMNE